MNAYCVALMLATAVRAFAQHSVSPRSCADARAEGAFQVYFEEDNLQTTPSTDRNYTMGLGVGRSSCKVLRQGHQKPLEWAERFIWRYALRPITQSTHSGLYDAMHSQVPGDAYGELLSGTAFTPADLHRSRPVVGDRPYAFLLGWTVTRTSFDTPSVAPPSRAVRSELTIGTIGSRLGRNVQRYIHQTIRKQRDCDPLRREETGPCDPKGWANQVMDVPSLVMGIPTIRYALSVDRAQSWVPRQGGSTMLELVESAGGELGYYTTAWTGMRARIGLFDSPFYAWNESPLGGQNRVPFNQYSSSGKTPHRLELFVFGGIRPRLSAYNALLQGYPGYKGYAFDAGSLHHAMLEGEIGASIMVRFGRSDARAIRLTHVFNAFRTAEYNGPYARAHQWGGWYLSMPDAWLPTLPNVLGL